MEILNKYRNWLLVNGRSANTAKNYISQVNRFLQAVDIQDITETSISDYLLECQEEYSNETINVHRASIISFLEFLKLDINLPKRLPETSKLPECITEEDFINKVIPVIKKMPEDLRLKALLYFMFYSGVRKSELMTLKRSDFDFDNLEVIIREKKTKKERIGTFNDTTRVFVQKYFISSTENNNAFNISSLSVLDRTFQEIEQSLDGINFYPHILRHGCATMLLRKGVDLRRVKKLMGHGNIQTTMRYLTVTDKDAIEEYHRKVK